MSVFLNSLYCSFDLYVSLSLVPHCQGYCLVLKSSSVNILFFFLKIILPFQINCMNQVVSFYKKSCRDFRWNCVNYPKISLGKSDILTVLSLLVHEHDIIFIYENLVFLSLVFCSFQHTDLAHILLIYTEVFHVFWCYYKLHMVFKCQFPVIHYSTSDF